MLDALTTAAQAVTPTTTYLVQGGALLVVVGAFLKERSRLLMKLEQAEERERALRDRIDDKLLPVALDAVKVLERIEPLLEERRPRGGAR